MEILCSETVSQGIGLEHFLGIKFVHPYHHIDVRVPFGLQNLAMMPAKRSLPAQISRCTYIAMMDPQLMKSKLWDTYSGETLETLPHEHVVRSVDISHSLHLIVSGGHEKRLRLFDIEHGGRSQDIGRHDGTIKSVVWSRNDGNDNIIVTSGDDRRVIWWDIRSPTPATEFATENMITSTERSADSRSIVVTGGNNVLVFDAATYHSIIIATLLIFIAMLFQRVYNSITKCRPLHCILVGKD